MKEFKNLNALLNVQALELDAETGGAHLMEMHLETIDANIAAGEKAAADLVTATASLTTANATINTLTQERDAATAARTTAETSLATATETITTLKAELAGKAAPTPKLPAGGPEGEDKKAPIDMGKGHNQIAAKMLGEMGITL